MSEPTPGWTSSPDAVPERPSNRPYRHPFDKCVCTRCGPPWRDEFPEPDESADMMTRMTWRSWMALCPTCGNKRCPGAADHDNPCSGSNEPGQEGSNYA